MPMWMNCKNKMQGLIPKEPAKSPHLRVDPFLIETTGRIAE